MGRVMTNDLGDVLLRLGAAALAGVVVGLNRDIEDKPIGMRTLSLVSLGSAIVVVSAINFPGMSADPDATSRVIQGIIQGVMTGISFIGAGVILRDAKAQTAKGLTTAATVWITAALGIACGLGAWLIAIIGAAGSLVLLIGLRWIGRRLFGDNDS
jgi:putative Mg2+ transporter-C (MgtC) family protein